MAEDEKWFFEEVCKYCTNHGRSQEDEGLFDVIFKPLFGGKGYQTKDYLTPRKIINLNRHRINHKRAWYLLSKWEKKGWYEYGTTLDLGWMTEKGNKVYLEMIREWKV